MKLEDLKFITIATLVVMGIALLIAVAYALFWVLVALFTIYIVYNVLKLESETDFK